VKVEVGLTFKIIFLTQHLGLSIFDTNLVWNNPAFFRVHYKWWSGEKKKRERERKVWYDPSWMHNHNHIS